MTNPQDHAFLAKRDELIQSILALLQIDGDLSVQQRSQMQTAIAEYALGIVGVCIASRRPPEFYDCYIQHIFGEIAQGRFRRPRPGRPPHVAAHVDGFLCSFAETLMRAQGEDVASLRAPALDFIERYSLAQYLDNFRHIDKKAAS